MLILEPLPLELRHSASNRVASALMSSSLQLVHNCNHTFSGESYPNKHSAIPPEIPSGLILCRSLLHDCSSIAIFLWPSYDGVASLQIPAPLKTFPLPRRGISNFRLAETIVADSDKNAPLPSAPNREDPNMNNNSKVLSWRLNLIRCKLQSECPQQHTR